MPKEVQLQELIRFFYFNGSRLAFARVLDREQMDLAEIQDPFSADEWRADTIGMREPAEGQASVPLSACDIIYVPGIVFGPMGERLGRGKGFYDRFLAQSPHALRISLCFDFQLVRDEPITQEEWDQKVDWIQTESQVLKTERVQSKLRRYTLES